jgi:hypothetical protein
LISSAALLLALGASPIAVAPSLAVDLDGNGAVETATATPARGSVRLRVSDANGRKLAQARAPAPAADVVPVTLSSAPLGSSGALLEVVASTDTIACRTIWRYRDGALTPLPVRDAAGKPLPDCGPAGAWTYSWEREGEGRPSSLARERSERVEAGPLRTREVFAFAGFSLDYDSARSSTEIDGIPIPDWYRATLYSRAGLEVLYSRFNLAALREQPKLRIEADRARGAFALRFSGPLGEILLPVEAYAARPGSATLTAGSGERTAHVEIRLEGEGGKVPFEARVSGLEASLDQVYAPAGSWRGGARQVFPDASAEIAAADLSGLWVDPSGKNQTIAIEGEPPYRVRMEGAAYTVDLDRAAPPLDLLLLAVEPSRPPRGVTLRGPNALEVFSLACAGPGAGEGCRPEGAGRTLRRVGARVNVR